MHHDREEKLFETKRIRDEIATELAQIEQLAALVSRMKAEIAKLQVQLFAAHLMVMVMVAHATMHMITNHELMGWLIERAHHVP